VLLARSDEGRLLLGAGHDLSTLPDLNSRLNALFLGLSLVVTRDHLAQLVRGLLRVLASSLTLGNSALLSLAGSGLFASSRFGFPFLDSTSSSGHFFNINSI